MGPTEDSLLLWGSGSETIKIAEQIGTRVMSQTVKISDFNPGVGSDNLTAKLRDRILKLVTPVPKSPPTDRQESW